MTRRARPAIAVTGWSRVIRGNRPIWGVAAASVACLLIGYTGASALSSAGAEPSTDGGPITVPVESRVLANTVKLRGDATFDDAIDLKVAAGELDGPAVVTGAVPVVGANLDALSVALEVAGRPVIVLPGQLPAYRTLRAGNSGPDVVQLKAALRAAGFDAGNSDTYDAATAAAVAAMYEKVGYAAPGVDPTAASALSGAEEAAAAAQKALDAAQRELTTAGKGPDRARRVELDNAVREAQRELAAARAAGDPAVIARAEDAVNLAQTQRDVAAAAPDTTAEAAAVAAARTELSASRTSLEKARQAALIPLPANEVQFLPTLPRRVDEVRTERGKVLEGAALVVSGATLSITAEAGSADAKLLRAGQTATVELPDGSETGATVGTVTRQAAKDGDKGKSAARWVVTFALAALTPGHVEQLRGQNVRVSVPVTATEGKVLVVPSAALSAGPGGETRVEVATGKDTRIVPVRTGLAADGLVEISGKLTEGDLVVVGR